MAYLFNRLNEALDGAQGSGKRGSDLLQGGAPVQQDKETLGGAPTGMSTQASAVIGAGGGATPKPAAAGEDTTAVNSEARNKTFAKNQGTQLQAGAADSLAGGIQQSQTALQGAADAYLKDGYGGFDRASVDKAVDANDETARTTVSDFLNTPTKDPEKFQFDASSLDGLRDQTRALQTDGGLQAALQEQNAGKAGSEGYTAGEARLDASFLKNSDAFKAQKAKVIDSFAGFAGASDAAGVEAKRRSEGYVEAVGKEKKGLRELLTGKAVGIRSAVETNLTAKNEQLGKERAAKLGAESQGIARDAQAKLFDLTEATKGLAPNANVTAQIAALKDMIANPARYASQDATAFSLEDAVSEDQAADFNWLNTVLGDGKTLTSRGGFAPSADASRRDTVAAQFRAIDELIKQNATVKGLTPEVTAGGDKIADSMSPGSFGKAALDELGDLARKAGVPAPGKLVPGLPPFLGNRTTNLPADTANQGINNFTSNLGLSGKKGISPAVAAAQAAREAAEADKIYDKGIVVGSKKAEAEKKARAEAAKPAAQKTVDAWNAKRNKENPAFVKVQGSFSFFGDGYKMTPAEQKSYDAWLKKNPPPKGA